MYLQHFVPNDDDKYYIQHHNDDHGESSRNARDYDNNTVRRFNVTKNDSYDQPIGHIKNERFNDWLFYKCSVVDNEYFQGFIVFAILANIVVMGIATMDFVTDNSITWTLFHQIDVLFMLLFTVEIIMQFIYRGKNLLSDPWLVCDVTIVAITWMFITVPFFHDFRGLRAARLVVKISEMRNLVAALIGATRRLFAVGMLLLLIFYVFGVMFTLFFKNLQEDGYTQEDYFSRLDVTFFTLFQFLTLDSWSSLTREVMVAFPWAWVPICTFISVSSFVVINLVIAVICESVNEVQRQEIEQNIQQLNSMISNVEETKALEVANLENKIDDLMMMIEELRNELKARDN